VVEIARRRLEPQEVARALRPALLIGLFGLCVALGALGRSWDGPAELLEGAGRWGTTWIAAAAAITINNLPAAALLSARSVAHPRALLLGLNVGPNFAATGSLSALLWWRTARLLGAQPSFVTFSRRGAPLAILAILAALGTVALFPTSV
jgi:arsenical pump membrane protein